MPDSSLLPDIDFILRLSLLFIGLLFTHGLVRLSVGYSRVRSTFKNLSEADWGINFLDQHFGDGNNFQSLWTSYSESLYELGGGRHVTTNRAASQFDVGSVFSKAMPLRYVFAVPALLVGIGILFTFVGLSIGLQSIETTSINVEQIGPLIEGMKTAFWSSVAGMFFSILFNLIEKTCLSFGEKHIRSFRAKMDTKYYINEFELATEIFGYRDESGHLIRPGYVLRDIKKASAEQSKALKSFSSDLADGIKISANSLDGLKDALEQVLAPTLQNLEGGVSDKLEAIFTGGVQEMMERMSGETISGLENVGNTIATTADSLSGLPELLKTLQEEMQAGVLDTGRKVQEEAEVTLEAFQKQVSQLAGQLQVVMNQATDSTSRLIDQNEANSEKTSSLIDRFDTTLASVASVVERTGEAAGQLASIQDSLKTISSDFVRTSASLTASAMSLDKSSESLSKGSAKIVDGMDKTLSNIQDTIAQSQKVLTESASQMDAVKNGIASIFGDIQSGLEQYQESTRTSLNRYLTEFSSQLAMAAQQLATTVESLEESLEQLNENLSSVGSATAADE